MKGPTSAHAGWPSLGLEIAGSTGLIPHFAREYGAPTQRELDGPRLIVRPLARARRASTISARLGPDGGPHSAATDRPIVTARHKTTRWRIRLGAPSLATVTCELSIAGVFGRSLVQSTVVEPLLSVVAARRGEALISASGIVVDGAAIAVAGVSRSGKSTLALRAWAAGRSILGDDRVILGPDGRLRGFPRRLRLYPDLDTTAPAAFSRLGGGVRRRLAIAAIVRRLSRGWVGLPVLVDRDDVGLVEGSVRLARVVVVDRVSAGGQEGADQLVATDDPERVAALLDAIAAKDLAWVAAQGPDWAAEAQRTREIQGGIIRQAVESNAARLTVMSLPASWPAPRAIEALARALGLEPEPGATPAAAR